MADASECLDVRMRNLPIHIYGYNNEHDVIVYTVVKDTQSEFGQPRHRFQKCLKLFFFRRVKIALKEVFTFNNNN